MTELTTDRLVWIAIAAIAGAAYALVFGWGRGRIRGEDDSLRLNSVGRVALEGAAAGVFLIVSGDELNIENLEATAPVVIPWVDNLVLMARDALEARSDE